MPPIAAIVAEIPKTMMRIRAGRMPGRLGMARCEPPEVVRPRGGAALAADRELADEPFRRGSVDLRPDVRAERRDGAFGDPLPVPARVNDAGIEEGGAYQVHSLERPGSCAPDGGEAERRRPPVAIADPRLATSGDERRIQMSRLTSPGAA
jgi:hypothetical protein